MRQHELSRRTVLKAGAIAGLTGMTAVNVTVPAQAAADPGTEVLIKWLDQPPPIPTPATENVTTPLIWEELNARYTPSDQFFTVKHYNLPDLTAESFVLTVDGLVDHPLMISLADLQSRPRREVDFTLECSGNHGFPFFVSGIGNARWTGASLAALLRKAAPQDDAVEVVFWGADRGPVTIRDDSGILSGGVTGTTEPDSTDGLDLTITEQFARSMSLAEAMQPDNMLCYEMNGAPLPALHGYPLRLIAPGWYGVANVKWLTRIELRDSRYAGRFMARDYVTIREETVNNETVWTFSTVGHARLKSAPARVLRHGVHYQVEGAAWGGEIDRVEVQIDAGPWQQARIRRMRTQGDREFSWRFWTFDWGRPAAGTYKIRSRAFGNHGVIQPAPDDPFLASRRTYWENNGQVNRTVQID
jgi:DMSO/TMAO reductase YedYZ molybdopterin-dependent catalytic subunit